MPRQYANKTVIRVETSSLRSDYSGSAFVPLQTRISHKPPYESINVKVYLYKGEDVITCCITRLNIIKCDDIVGVIDDQKKYYSEPSDFYTDLASAIMNSYHAAKTAINFEYMRNEGCGYCAIDLALDEYVEKYCLGYIIVMCIKRLAKLGYDESARQEIYQAVNEKNRKRGYFEEVSE